MNTTRGPNRKGGPKSAIEFSPHRAAIVRDLGAGASTRTVAMRYGFSKAAVQRFKSSHLAPAMRKREESRKVRDADAIGSRMESLLELSEKMQRSLDAALQDPNDPTRYSMDLRASEVDVIWTETVPGEDGKSRQVRRRGLLSEILRRVPGEIVFLQSKREDLRRLMIDCQRAMTDLLTQIARVQGIVKGPGVEINIMQDQRVLALLGDVRDVLQDYPGALEAIMVRWEEKALADQEEEGPPADPRAAERPVLALEQPRLR